MAQAELIHEAAQIADGKTAKLGTTAHVEALVGFLRQIADRWPVDRPIPDTDADMLDEESVDVGYFRAVAGTAVTIRAALEGR
jgi:hypothetical protein